ncbi:MAG: hypothetical protein ABEK02_05565 [Haloquadratum sp.]
MHRRTLLSSIPALVVGSVAGCLSRSAGDSTPAETQTQTSLRLPPSGYGTVSGFSPGEPFETYRVGTASDDHRHRVVVWNADSVRRDIRVRLREAATGEPLVAVEPRFPAYGSLSVRVHRPADYVVDVAPQAGEGRSLGVPRSVVDCNYSATQVAVRPDGSINARVVSTTMACDVDSPTPGRYDAPTERFRSPR